jgi:hypothetical protein
MVDKVNDWANAEHFRSVTHPHIYEPVYRSPQRPFWTFCDDAWLKVLRVPQLPARKKRVVDGRIQPPLFG